MTTAPDRASSPVLLLLTLLVCVAGAALVFVSSLWGIGVSPDSAEYIAAARRLNHFSDLFTISAHWPPGYPLLLKFAYLFSTDYLKATRVLQCVLLAGNLWVGTLLLRKVAQSSALAVIAGTLVFLVSYNIYQIYFYVWSEGPFILLQQLSALALLQYLAQQRRAPLLAAALVAGLALMFRYAGIAWIGAAALALLLLQTGNWRQRLRASVLFGLVAVVPFMLWLLANHFIRDETTNRQFVVHLVTGGELVTLLLQFLSWFGGLQLPLLGLALFLLSTAVLVLALKPLRAVPAVLRHFGVLSGCYCIGYTVFILFSKSFLDAYIPFDARIFVPVYVFLFLLLAAAAVRLFNLPSWRLRTLGGVWLLAFTLLNMLQLLPLVLGNIDQGAGYLSAYMVTLPDVSTVPQLGGRIVYSNAPDYLRMVTSFEVHDYPRQFDPTTQLANPGYAADVAAMREQVSSGQALLVHYQALEGRTYFPAFAELEGLGFVTVMSAADDGVRILSFPAAQAPPAAP